MEDLESLVESLYDLDDKIAYQCLLKLKEESSKTNKVYSFFNTFISMLNNSKSYIRNRGIVLINENIKWDTLDILNNNIDAYLERITDEKPITARECIKTLSNIAKYKPSLKEKIISTLVNVNLDKYTESMKDLIKKDIKNVINEINLL